MKTRLYIYLCDDARAIRNEVFVKEQGFVTEFDGNDDISLHVVVYEDDGTPIGTARLFSEEPGVYSIGRVAVIKSARGRGIGRYILNRLMAECSRLCATTIKLWAQEQAVEFYERFGFEETKETMTEDGVRHVKMVRYI